MEDVRRSVPTDPAPLPDTPDAQFAWSFDGRLVDVNSAGCALLDSRREHAIGARTEDLVKIPDDALAALLAEAREDGVGERLLSFETRTGGRHLVAIRVGRSDDRLLGVAREQGDGAALSTEAARVVARILNDIAHELRDPLGAIQTSAEVLAKLLVLDEEEGALLTVIVKEVQRLKYLLNDFLLYVRPPRLKPRPVRLAALLRDALDLVPHTDPKYRDIRLTLPDESGDPEMESDADAITHMLLNLLLNAYEAVGRDGEVIVAVECPGDRLVSIEVSDSGPGIPPEDAERVWEPFFTTKRVRPGLGLPAVRRTAEAMGGGAELVPGRPTTVRIRIPRRLASS